VKHSVSSYITTIVRQMKWFGDDCPPVVRDTRYRIGVALWTDSTKRYGPPDIPVMDSPLCSSEPDIALEDVCACPKLDDNVSLAVHRFIAIAISFFNPLYTGLESVDLPRYQQYQFNWITGLCDLCDSNLIGASLPPTYPDLPTEPPDTRLVFEILRNTHAITRRSVIDAYRRGTGISMCLEEAKQYHQALFEFVFTVLHQWK